MVKNFFQKSLSILLKQQTNILSAAFIIMAMTILSQLLGLIKKRLLVATFGASNIVGVYDVASKFPDALFQLVIAAAISSAFIPVFSNYLTSNREKEGHEMASNLLTVGIIVFGFFALILVIFAPFVLRIFNPGSGFTPSDMTLMANLLRIIIVGQFLFIIGIFFSALLQSYNHFLIPAFAAATFNLGVIIGIFFLSPFVGIYSAAYGGIIGALCYIVFQIPLVKKVGFGFRPNFSFTSPSLIQIYKLIWPRTLAQGFFQLGPILIVSLLSFSPNTGRNYFIFDLALTLAFAPVALIGQAIAQAAFPVLSRQRERLEDFKVTFLTSFSQMLYLILPISILFLVLRIPIVRLVYGAAQFDWPATVLTGRLLAILCLSLFAQALFNLVSRAFYALHDTITPLIVGAISTIIMIGLAAFMVLTLHMGISSIAFAYSVGTVFQFVVLFLLLSYKTGGFKLAYLFSSFSKIIIATFFTGFALYIPLKLLDQLVFDTTHTINLIFLTGITSIIGLSLYLFLTWIFQVREARTYVVMFGKLGNWKEILTKVQELLESTSTKV